MKQTVVDTRLPPTDLEAETRLLGSLLTYDLDRSNGLNPPWDFDQVTAILSSEAFAIEDHREIYILLAKLHRNGGSVIVNRLPAELEAKRRCGREEGWEFLLGELIRQSEPANTLRYAHFIADAWQRRGLMRVGQRIIDGASVSGPTAKPVVQLIDELINDPAMTPPGEQGAGGLATRCLADVQREQVSWLWPHRFALGKLSILCGDPGLGKSFVTLDWAAKLTTGTPWPDQRDVPIASGDVLVLTAEDGVEDTVYPRFDDAGGKLNRVTIIDGVHRSKGDDFVDPFNLDQDVRRLGEALEANDEIRLIVIDPLSAYLGKECDSHKDADVRRVLMPLCEMAARHRVAVLGVMHLNKSTKGRAIHRAMGSLAFVAAARSVWLMGKDRADPERRLILQVKNNLAPDPGGLAFRIRDPGVVYWDADPVWGDADTVLSDINPQTQTASTEVHEWLAGALNDGPVPSGELQKEAKELGFCWRTVMSVKKSMGVLARRTGEHWLWRLP